MPASRADRHLGLTHSALTSASSADGDAVPLAWSLRGDWRLRLMLTAHRQHVEVEVTPPEPLAVTDEPHASLPEFNPDAAGWTKGDKLLALLAQETTTPGLLHAESVVVTTTSAGRGEAAALARGVDFEIDEQWGTIGWLPGGSLAPTDGGSPSVLVSYVYTPLRLDSLVLRTDNSIELRMGEPYGAAPPAPELAAGEQRLMNIWLPGRAAEAKLTPASLFPVLETATPDLPASPLSLGAIPKTLAKLQNGEDVTIMAWGDSVTDGSYLPSPADRWQIHTQAPVACDELILFLTDCL